MKIVAIIPIKKDSQRVRKKNFRKINGTPLYKITLDKLKKCKFDDVYVDSDSEIIKKYCKKNKINFISRKPALAKNSANGNHLLLHHAKLIKADVYFQIFITSPLLKISTINKCVQILKDRIKKKTNDSILTVQKIYSWFWFNKKPINYNPKVLPRSQDAKPVILETTGIYGITRESLIKFKSRIGKKPYFFEVSDDENIDLDNEKDFKYLEFITKK